MNSLDARFRQLLERRVQEERQRHVDSLVDGSHDQRQYSRTCGIIWLLDQVREWADDIDKQINEGR